METMSNITLPTKKLPETDTGQETALRAANARVSVHSISRSLIF